MWDLKLRQVYNIVLEHPNDTKRTEWFNKLTNNPEHKYLQVGVAPWAGKYGLNWTSIDKYDFRPCIDYNFDICNWGEMEIFEGQFDLVQCNAILEHVKNPFDAANTIIKILKPGGVAYVEVPFIQPYHPHGDWDETMPILDLGDSGRAPHGGDYWRFTPQGVRELFKDLDVLDLFICSQGGVVFVGSKKVPEEGIL